MKLEELDDKEVDEFGLEAERDEREGLRGGEEAGERKTEGLGVGALKDGRGVGGQMLKSMERSRT